MRVHGLCIGKCWNLCIFLLALSVCARSGVKPWFWGCLSAQNVAWLFRVLKILCWIERPLHYLYVFASCARLLVLIWNILYVILNCWHLWQWHWDKLKIMVLAADKWKIFIVSSDCCLLETEYRKVAFSNGSFLRALKILRLVDTEDRAVKTVSAFTCFDTPQTISSLSLHYSHTIVVWCTHRTFVLVVKYCPICQFTFSLSVSLTQCSQRRVEFEAGENRGYRRR